MSRATSVFLVTYINDTEREPGRLCDVSGIQSEKDMNRMVIHRWSYVGREGNSK